MEMAPVVFQFTVDNLKMKISSCHTILQVIFLSFFFNTFFKMMIMIIQNQPQEHNQLKCGKSPFSWDCLPGVLFFLIQWRVSRMKSFQTMRLKFALFCGFQSIVACFKDSSAFLFQCHQLNQIKKRYYLKSRLVCAKLNRYNLQNFNFN